MASLVCVHSCQVLKSCITGPVNSATNDTAHGLPLPWSSLLQTLLRKPLCGPRLFPSGDVPSGLEVSLQSKTPGAPHGCAFCLHTKLFMAGNLISKSTFSEETSGHLNNRMKGKAGSGFYPGHSPQAPLDTAMHHGRGWSCWNTMYLIKQRSCKLLIGLLTLKPA